VERFKSYGKQCECFKIREVENMNEKLIDLQLFAEGDGEAGAEVSAPDNNEGGNPQELEKHEEPKAKYTDEDVNKILDRKFAEWQKKKDKEKSEAKRLGEMTAEERANERLKDLEKRIHDYETREARAEMMKEARVILQGNNLHLTDTLLANLIADDAETTKANVEAFTEMFNAAVEKAVKDRVKADPPRKGAPPTGLTKEQIMKVANRAERQRLIKENFDLFQ
jgi:hypothetical protein